MKKIQEFIAQVQKALDQERYGSEPKDLYQPIYYILDLGGKRIRPALSLVACELFGGKAKDALKPAMGIEIFHNFSLIHDDIMDAAPIRRGQPTVHQKWNTNVGILSGDAMLVKAYQYIAQVNPNVLPAVLDIFSKTAIEVCEGQQYDMDFEALDKVSEEAYIEMIRLKTSVLLGCALQIGALVAQASEEDVKAIYNYGVNIGIAFQIQDDILDTYGETAQVGKQHGGDIIQDKKTLLRIYAASQTAALEDWTGKHHNTAEKVTAVKAIYEQCGARNYAVNRMQFYYDKAIKQLETIKGANPDLLEELKAFSSYLVKRDS